jgi:hypothetical protein
MGDSNFCFICGQPWTRHSWERCDEIAEQTELEDDQEDDDEDQDEEEDEWSQFSSRLDDGFRMLSGFDEE